MHGGVTVTGQFGCSSADLKFFYVSSLETPLGLCKESLLRSSDVISVDFGSNPKLVPDVFESADEVNQ